MLLRNTIGAIGSAALCATLAGCAMLHRQQVAPLAPQPKTPNIYVPPPGETTLPPMDGKPPADVTDAKPAVAAEAKPKKRVRRQPAPPVPVAAAPVPVADTPAPPAPEVAKLGALGSGADADPRQQQDVAGKIAGVDKRLNELPAALADRESKQVAKVRQFTKEASDALKGGDVDGARILATKAQLLLDDLAK